MIDKPVIILGAEGHAKVLSEVLKLLNSEILGYVTTDSNWRTWTNKKKFCDSEIIGDENIVFSIKPDNIKLINGIGSLPFDRTRFEVAKKMRNKGYKFSSIIHPESNISLDIKLSEGVQIMKGVVMQPGIKVGTDTIINTGSLIDHDCEIEENCHIAPGVVCSGGVKIGKNTHVGTGSKIIQGIKIGEGCIIAAGSTIYKDIPSRVLFKQEKTNIIEKIDN